MGGGHPQQRGRSCASTRHPSDEPVLAESSRHGAVRIAACECGDPPSEAGQVDVSLEPGSSGAVTIVLDSSKDVTEETPLVVAEAKGGVLSAASRTLTLTFIGPKGRVSTRKIDEINLLGPEGNIDEELTTMFTIAGGAIVAIDPGKVIGIIRTRGAGPVVLSVQAFDSQEIIHASRVEFRME